MFVKQVASTSFFYGTYSSPSVKHKKGIRLYEVEECFIGAPYMQQFQNLIDYQICSLTYTYVEVPVNPFEIHAFQLQASYAQNTVQFHADQDPQN